MELKAYQAYRNPELDIRYWRTSTGMEVDFILGEMDVALEVKGARRVHEVDLKGLTALLHDQKVKHPLLISLEREPRKMGAKVRALPWEVFLRELWSGALGYAPKLETMPGPKRPAHGSLGPPIRPSGGEPPPGSRIGHGRCYQRLMRQAESSGS
jgi:hypothetical protein